jgi:hypothetical protein
MNNETDLNNRAAVLQAAFPELRRGQALMIALRDRYPELYVRFTGSDADCYYSDSRIPQFVAALPLQDAVWN